jgi:hypothetical protein
MMVMGKHRGAEKENKMAMQSYMNELVNVLINYYENAKEFDDNYNALLLRSAINTYRGDDLVLVGYEFIADALVTFAQVDITTFERDGMAVMNHHLSLVKALGDKGIYFVEGVLQRAKSEDHKALAAFTLSNPYFRNISIDELKKYYGNAYNSSYQIALAWALYQHGEKGYFKTLASKFILTNPPSDDSILENAIRTKIPSQLVFGLIAGDIASNGLDNKASWRRKHS